MHTSNQLLDAVAAKFGGCSDYRLSKILHTSTSGITNWRKGRAVLSVEFAHRVARLLEWDPAYVTACVEHERALRASDSLEETQEIVATWERIAEHFRPAVPIILIALLGLFTATRRADATEPTAPTHPQLLIAPSIHYAQLSAYPRRRRRERRHLRRRVVSPRLHITKDSIANCNRAAT